MALLVLIGAGLVGWLYATNRLTLRDGDNIALVGLAGLALSMALSGRPLPAALAGGAACGWWLWRRRGLTKKSKAMPVDEALALLGLDHTADASAIRGAHRRLIAQVHPDKGGTPELAQRINAARDCALRALNNQPPRSS